jgi:hypothetical protein
MSSFQALMASLST